ncbi:MAG: hypothetical protein WCN88_05080 [Candidatus Falkowbacteria bacterium]
MFSLKMRNHNPIAYVKGGYLDKKILYLHDPEVIAPNDDRFFDDIELEDGSFSIYPETRPDQTDRIMIASAPGSGKSYLVNDYITKFHSIFPDSAKTILFTNHKIEDFDKAYSSNKENITHFEINDEILEPRIELSDICNKEGSDYIPQLIVFDDYVGNKNKIEAEIFRLRNLIGANGRKLKLYQIVCQSDLPIKNASFRDYITNITKLIYFPKRKPSNIRNVLKNYFDVPDEIFADFNRNNNSRWVLYIKQDIPYMLSEFRALIFDIDREESRIREENMARKQTIRERLDRL